jgi:hypothetical protein
MTISTLLLKKKEPCGINLFNVNLTNSLKKHNVETNEFSIIQNIKSSDKILIFHYVPSLYKNYSQEITQVFNDNLNIISIIHGIYPNRSFDYMGDTVNENHKSQLDTIVSKSKALVFLSHSTHKFFKTWHPKIQLAKHFVLMHPGVNQSVLISESTAIKDYVFIGGINRLKKDFESESIRKLLISLKKNGIKVWLHSSNSSLSKEMKNLVWKTSQGEITRKDWNKVIKNSKIILCPYFTEIQTVSGIISEGVSCGKKIISTRFPFALEISKSYSNHIIINNDLNTWPYIIRDVWNEKLKIPYYPDWNEFTSELLKIIKTFANKV